MKTNGLRVQLMVTGEEVQALARATNADADRAGLATMGKDQDVRQRLVSRVIGQAAIVHGLKGKGIAEVVRREYAEFLRVRAARAKRQRKTKRQKGKV